MILRFQSKNGQFRLEIDAAAEISSILPQIAEKLPKDAILSSITISPKPQGKDSRPIESLKGVTFGKLGMVYVSAISCVVIPFINSHITVTVLKSFSIMQRIVRRPTAKSMTM